MSKCFWLCQAWLPANSCYLLTMSFNMLFFSFKKCSLISAQVQDIFLSLWIDIYTLPCVKQLVGTCYKAQGAQLSTLWWPRWLGWRVGWKGGPRGRECVIYMVNSLHCPAESNTTFQSSYTTIIKKKCKEGMWTIPGYWKQKYVQQMRLANYGICVLWTNMQLAKTFCTRVHITDQYVKKKGASIINSPLITFNRPHRPFLCITYLLYDDEQISPTAHLAQFGESDKR